LVSVPLQAPPAVSKTTLQPASSSPVVRFSVSLAGWQPVTSNVPVLRDPSRGVQDAILFAFDDSFLLSDVPGSHIRALRDAQWTYAVYYGSKGVRFE
jgi:hypothetical protein